MSKTDPNPQYTTELIVWLFMFTTHVPLTRLYPKRQVLHIEALLSEHDEQGKGHITVQYAEVPLETRIKFSPHARHPVGTHVVHPIGQGMQKLLEFK